MKHLLATLIVLSMPSLAAHAGETPLENKELYPIAKLSPTDRTAFNATYLNKLYSGKLAWAGPATFKLPLTQREETGLRFGLGWADSVYCNDSIQLKGGLTLENAEGTDVLVTGRVIDYEAAANGAVLRVYLKECEAEPAGEATADFEIPSFD